LLASRALTVDTGGVFDINLGTASGDDFTIDTSAFVVEGNTGYVGVGVASPSTNLHVSYSNSSGDPHQRGLAVSNLSNTSDGDSTLMLQTAGASGGDSYISFTPISAGGWAMGLDNSDSDKFKLSYTWNDLATDTKLTVDTSGNIGIGDSSPSVKLDVAGD